MSAPHEATRLLEAAASGDQNAARDLLPVVYDELRRLAAYHQGSAAGKHTLQPTALVHEAFMRLIEQTGAQWNSKAHFMAVASIAMRQILMDSARRRRALKRGGDAQRVGLDHAQTVHADDGEVDTLALDDALTRLQQIDARKYRITELRFFGGLSVQEIADVLGVSKTTIESEWRSARAWLAAELGDATAT